MLQMDNRSGIRDGSCGWQPVFWVSFVPPCSYVRGVPYRFYHISVTVFEKKTTGDALIRCEERDQIASLYIDESHDIWKCFAEGLGASHNKKAVKIRMQAATWILEGNVEQHLQSSQMNDWCHVFDVGNMLNAVRSLSYPISMTNI